MLIDKKITEKIAKLAKIKLSEEDIDEYSKDLSKILTWIDKLKEVDTEVGTTFVILDENGGMK